MFALFAILGWSLVLGSSVLVIGISSFGMYLNVAIGHAITAGDMTKVSNLSKLADNPILNFFNKDLYGHTKLTTVFFGPEGATPNTYNSFVLYVAPIITIVAAALLIMMAIIELHRLRKAQKVSKPFIKIILVIALIMNMILGKALTVIAGASLFVALVFLEIVLFDTDALNNYAEERNLVSIYREERKFEREVNKEGKLIDNTDSETLMVQKTENSNMLDQDEKAKTNDNSVLSSEIKYSDIEYPVTDPSQINNKKYQKYYGQWKQLKEQLDKFRQECYDKVAEGISEKNRDKLQAKFNERAEKVNIIATELKLMDSFKIPFIDLTNATDAPKSTEESTEQVAFSTPQPVKTEATPMPQPTNLNSGGALGQATGAFSGEKSTDFDPGIEQIYNQHTTPEAKFAEPNFPNLASAPAPDGGRPETFVIPTTEGTQELKKRAEAEKAMMQAAMAHAIRMDWTQLPETDKHATATVKEMLTDLGINAETKDLSYGTKEINAFSSAPTPAPEHNNDAPSFDTKITAPPIGDFNMAENPSEVANNDVPAFTTSSASSNSESVEQPQTFIIPTTMATTQLNKRAEAEKAMMKAALAHAIRMDWTQLPETDKHATATIHDMENDLGLHVETKDLSYGTTQIQNIVEERPVTTPMQPAPSVPTPVASPEPAPVVAPAFTTSSTPTPAVEPAQPAPATPMMSAPVNENVSAPHPVVNEIHSMSPNINNGAEVVKIDQIERRMENIEKMIQSLSLAQNYQPATNNVDSEKVDKLKDEFSKIEEQLARISQTFDISSNEPKNLFGALIRGYKYNNKK